MSLFQYVLSRLAEWDYVQYLLLPYCHSRASWPSKLILPPHFVFLFLHVTKFPPKKVQYSVVDLLSTRDLFNQIGVGFNIPSSIPFEQYSLSMVSLQGTTKF